MEGGQRWAGSQLYLEITRELQGYNLGVLIRRGNQLLIALESPYIMESCNKRAEIKHFGPITKIDACQ